METAGIDDVLYNFEMRDMGAERTCPEAAAPQCLPLAPVWVCSGLQLCYPKGPKL